MDIKRLSVTDKNQYFKLIHEIEKNIINHDFWLPIKEKAKINFFNDKWTYILGMYDNDNLIAATSLFLDKFEYEESAKEIGIEMNNLAEIGRCMVHPMYRGNNILYKLNVRLVEDAKIFGIKKLISTIHPDNIASLKSFAKLGFHFHKTIIKESKFKRSIFTLNIE